MQASRASLDELPALSLEEITKQMQALKEAMAIHHPEAYAAMVEHERAPAIKTTKPNNYRSQKRKYLRENDPEGYQAFLEQQRQSAKAVIARRMQSDPNYAEKIAEQKRHYDREKKAKRIQDMRENDPKAYEAYLEKKRRSDQKHKEKRNNVRNCTARERRKRIKAEDSAAYERLLERERAERARRKQKERKKKNATSAHSPRSLDPTLWAERLNRYSRRLNTLSLQEASEMLGMTQSELIVGGINGQAPRPIGVGSDGTVSYEYESIKKYAKQRKDSR